MAIFGGVREAPRFSLHENPRISDIEALMRPNPVTPTEKATNKSLTDLKSLCRARRVAGFALLGLGAADILYTAVSYASTSMSSFEEFMGLLATTVAVGAAWLLLKLDKIPKKIKHVNFMLKRSQGTVTEQK